MSCALCAANASFWRTFREHDANKFECPVQELVAWAEKHNKAVAPIPAQTEFQLSSEKQQVFLRVSSSWHHVLGFHTSSGSWHGRRHPRYINLILCDGNILSSHGLQATERVLDILPALTEFHR